MINVTEPFLPPIEEYQSYIESIWERNWLTNNGPLVTEFEQKLINYLDVSNVSFVANGTIALQLAIKALAVSGEVITTPFSYVATTSSLVWEDCSPVFVDIDKKSLNINPDLIESAITSKTSAILATHVYGNPCDIEAIQSIADKHNLKVIYDAAHCFGTQYKNKSVFEYGDISITSFHATKLFHTIEGGAVFTKDAELLKKVNYLRNFGHDGPDRYNGVGINGKNSEMHAAMGLVNLKYADAILAKRKADYLSYHNELKGNGLQEIKINEQAKFNYAYYPIIFKDEEQCLAVLEALKVQDIHARRYFYPLLSDLDYVNSKELPIAQSISSRVLCLPIYYQLNRQDIRAITRTINQIISA